MSSGQKETQPEAEVAAMINKSPDTGAGSIEHPPALELTVTAAADDQVIEGESTLAETIPGELETRSTAAQSHPPQQINELEPSSRATDGLEPSLETIKLRSGPDNAGGTTYETQEAQDGIPAVDATATAIDRGQVEGREKKTKEVASTEAQQVQAGPAIVELASQNDYLMAGTSEPVLLRFSSEGLHCQPGKKKSIQYHIEDIVGASIGDDMRSLVIHCYPRKGKSRVPVDVRLVLRSTSSPELLSKWQARILNTLYSPQNIESADCPKKYRKFISGQAPSHLSHHKCPFLIYHIHHQRVYVVVNPIGGKGQGIKICKQIVIPLFTKAHMDVTVAETQRAEHAVALARDLDLAKYDAIVAVGGDGALWEVIQGLYERPDWKTALRMPVGVVPAGSGNGLIVSLMHALNEPSLKDATLAAHMLSKRETHPMDLMVAETMDKLYCGFLGFEWAFIADVDIGSEKYRYLGGARFSAAAVMKLMGLKKYRGKLSYQELDNSEAKPYWETASEQDNLKCSPLPPLTAPVPESWKTLEGDFINFWAVSPSHCASDAFTNPGGKLHDGNLTLLIQQTGGRAALSSMFMGLEKGEHLKQKHLNVVKTRAFRLEPESGLVCIDGELLPTAPVQVRVYSQVINLLARSQLYKS